jgi:cell division septum initiation protein DivIVA
MDIDAVRRFQEENKKLKEENKRLKKEIGIFQDHGTN